MIFDLIDGFGIDPIAALINFLAFAAALAVGITVHEFSHALAAARLGDDTAQRQGRLTLNPAAHLDPVGTILIFVAGFGWGKPTPVTASRLRIGERAGMAVVALAGPASNMVVATLAALPIRMGTLQWMGEGVDSQILSVLALWNVVLAVFNLLPVAPLDGFKVALGILPRALARPFEKTERFGVIFLLALVLVDSVFRVGILSTVMFPMIRFVLGALVGG